MTFGQRAAAVTPDEEPQIVAERRAGDGRQHHPTEVQAAESCQRGAGEQRGLARHRQPRIFEKDAQGRRPVFGGAQKFQDDPNWRDHLLFYEYFHGDNGAGLGASHQTGWTGVIARAMHMFATTTAAQVRELGQTAAITETASAWSQKLAAR